MSDVIEKPERDVLLDIEAGIAELFRSGRSAVRTYAQIVDPELQPTGFHILRMILQHAPAQASSIIATMGLDKSAVSRQLKVLRDLKLIEATPDPRDGRSSFLTPTPLADERMELVRQHIRRDYRERVAEWPSEDLLSFSILLERFNASAMRD